MSEFDFYLIGPNRTPKDEHLLRQCDGLQNSLYGKNIGQTGRLLIARDMKGRRRPAPFYFVLADSDHRVVAFARFGMSDSESFSDFWAFGAIENSAWASLPRGSRSGGRSAEIVALCFDTSRFKSESGSEDALKRAQIVEDILERGRPYLQALNINRFLVACTRSDAFIFSKVKYPRKQIQLANAQPNISYLAFRISRSDFSEYVPMWLANSKPIMRSSLELEQPQTTD